jgi:hypothetical protein
MSCIVVVQDGIWGKFINTGGNKMTFKNLLIIKAVVCLAFAILFLLAPTWLFELFGVTLSVGGTFPAREYGAALAGAMMLTWFAREMAESEARRPILMYLLVYDIIGFIATTVYILSGVLNPLGWGPAAIYLFFTVGSGYLLAKK